MHPAAIRLRLKKELTREPASGPGILPTGIPEIDALTEGLPRGQITEVTGDTSSGRTSLLLSVLAEVSRREEVVALVDPARTFDPASAAAFGVDLERLLWIRMTPATCRLDPILRVTDLLLQGGGFGLIGVDLGDLPRHEIRRLPQSTGFRFQRAAEHTPTALVFLGREPILKSTAALALRTDMAATLWSGLLVEARPEARILRSRSDPSSCRRQTRPFRLVPTALINSGVGAGMGAARPEGVS